MRCSRWRRPSRLVPSIRSPAPSGRGAEATVGGRVVTVASSRLVTERGLTIGPELVHATREHTGGGNTVVYVIDAEQVVGMIAVADVIRPESAEAVAALKAR